MADWSVTFNGKIAVSGLENVISTGGPKPDLKEQCIECAYQIRKGKHEHEAMTLSVTPDSLQGDSSGTPFHQPLGRIVSTHSFAEGSLKKAYLFTYVAVDDGCKYGAADATYTCYTFKCKSESEANALAYATGRTMVTLATAARSRPAALTQDSTKEEINACIKWWNANNAPLFHFALGKDDTITGNLKVLCQVDQSLRTATKVVRITSNSKGDELVKLFADKFNLEVNLDDYAVFDNRDGDQIMLLENDAPILKILTWPDPFEGSFWLRRIPQGLVRVATKTNVLENLPQPINTSQGQTSMNMSTGGKEAPLTSTPVKSPNPASHTPDRRTSLSVNNVTRDETSTDEDVGLGPHLPYHPDDEDLLLNVMIARQTGTALGFKLTPAYLLQMCIAHAATSEGGEALIRLLTKIGKQVRNAIEGNPQNAELQLFWSCNLLKLMSSVVKDAAVEKVYNAEVKTSWEQSLDMSLSNLTALHAQGEDSPTEIPAALQSADWTSLNALRGFVLSHMRSLDQSMSHSSLQEVVARITAAMPSPRKKSQAADDGPKNGGPMTSTPMARSSRSSTDAGDALDSSSPNGGNTSHEANPLPKEWEELVDQDTQHRFFANHVTKQTSWTDPRDKLTTVTLVKGDRGLGLGISGARRTKEDRLILGIFVSSLVPGSAAAVEGTLHDGDEILEVNGHSLIGVSREGAIEFLKQVKLGETVTLLVAQEPQPSDIAAKLRHTAL